MILLLPILIPLFGAAVALVLRKRIRAQEWWSMTVLVAALGSVFVLFYEVQRLGSPLVYQPGGWPAPVGISFVADLPALLFATAGIVVAAAAAIHALGSYDPGIRHAVFYPMLLMLTAGLSGAFLTGDLFNLFVFAELIVISAAALTALAAGRYGVEAAFKYFYISLLASIFMLLAIGGLYAAFGTLNMADLARLAASESAAPLLVPAAGLLAAAFLIKSAAVPFHFWQPDFHAAAPAPLSALLSAVVVKLGVYGLLRMTTLLFVEQAWFLRSILIVLGLIGAVFGGLAAFASPNLKRMLAYSTLAQVGLILVALGWGSPLALAAALVLTFNHALLKAGLFLLAGAVTSRAPGQSPAFSALTGVGRRSPVAGVLFLLGGLGLAGVPPANGFVSKLLLFQSGLDGGSWAELVLILVAGLLTLAYMARAFIKIWWLAPLGSKKDTEAAQQESTKPGGDPVEIPSGNDMRTDSLVAAGLLLGLALLIGIWAQPLVGPAMAAAEYLSDPAVYISSVFVK